MRKRRVVKKQMSAARTAPLPTEGQSATLNDEQAHLESVGQYIENVQRNYSHPANLPPLPSSRGPATATDLAGFDVSPERSGDHDLEEPYSVTVFEMTCKSVINPWEGFDFQRNARSCIPVCSAGIIIEELLFLPCEIRASSSNGLEGISISACIC
ncbi:uncharacterized protein LOC133363284 isoform X5 [Rhineura floridana]|uniref:uncharacterized protein LOC133363284 isoform X5 n=1 Tax=Rhineura floridana TaxID=261503 RepID=UPI002AC82A87|nr:uncharacterized protein LOC133363284 isoform X5 [Rhineura floridana]